MKPLPIDSPFALLRDFKPSHKRFIGVDSDGCVFDSMELKHKECFIPETIRVFNLQAVSRYAREAAEFVNLYSQWRGANRFPALVRTLDLLRKRPETRRRGVEVFDTAALEAWIARETRLGEPALEAEVAAEGHPALTRVLEWSRAVNAAIARMVRGVGPFAGVRRALEAAGGEADVLVVSQTPGEALAREWSEHGLDVAARMICGQEMGTKSEHLRYAAAGKYAPENILMIGDAPGDLRAALDNGASFFPVNPGAEETSWRRLVEEGLPRFLQGTFAGRYQAALLAEFEALLPRTPPWERG